MTAYTPIFALPSPETTDPPDGPSQLEDLALAVEAELAQLNGTGAPAWTAFTPTWTNLTVGNGVNASAYIKRGRLVVARYKFTFGSTSAMGTGPLASLPVAGNTNVSRASGGSAIYRDASGPANYVGHLVVANTTQVQFLRGALEAFTGPAATTPFTWATTDEINGTVVYEAAS